jgi:hypothetical protein
MTAFAEKLLRIFPFPMPKLRGFGSGFRFQVSGRRNTKAKLQPWTLKPVEDLAWRYAAAGNTETLVNEPYYLDSAWGLMITSIRRLIARPSAVLLDAKGRFDP